MLKLIALRRSADYLDDVNLRNATEADMDSETLEMIFSLTGALAMVGWAALILLPGVDFVVRRLTRMIIPGLIGVLYVGLMIIHLGDGPADGGFGSLAGVAALFTVEGLLLAGWIHYLAFDLFVGSWEVEDARSRGLPHLLVIPCLLLTFMGGPAGLLLYLILRTGKGWIAGRRGGPAQAVGSE
jgi:hypothetical protein